MKRLLYVDISKAIGLCLVVLSHSVSPKLMFFAIGCFVPVFFVASGYTTKTINLQKKAKRLLAPYALFSVLCIVLYLLKQLFFHSTYDGVYENLLGVVYSRYAIYPLNVGPNVYIMQAGNAPLWFLTSMFVGYIALKPLLCCPKLRVVVIGAYFILLWLFNKLPILLPWSLDTAPLMALFIYSGIITQKNGILKNNKWWWWGVVVACYCIVTYINGYENLSVRDYGHSILLCFVSGVLGSLLIMKFAMFISKCKLGNYLARIGQKSLTVFCVQMPLLVCAKVVFSEVCSPIVVAFLQLVTTMIVGYGIAVIAHRYMPKLL